MNDDFDYTEIDKEIEEHKALARDLFVALVGKEGTNCWPDTEVLAYLAIEMATDFEDGYLRHFVRSTGRDFEWDKRLEKYLAKRFGDEE
jgi:hypothetical protein